MAEPAPAVALLFDDEALAAQLREALSACGIRIVYQGGLADAGSQALVATGADVLVVNLDEDDDEDRLDRLHEALGDHPHVVFNDARASAGLAGWDRARWARHLAAKVLAVSDVHPPRPDHARPLAAAAGTAIAADAVTATTDVPSPFDPTAHVGVDGELAARSETLAAELEALLAGADHAAGETNDPGAAAPTVARPEGGAHPPAPGSGSDPAGADANSRVSASSARLHESWSLLDDDALAGTIDSLGAGASGATGHAVPMLEAGADTSFKPGLNLELEPMADPSAPSPAVLREGAGEMLLDTEAARLSNLVLLGATADAVDAVTAFLAALPADTRLTFLLTQHLAGMPVEHLVEALARSSRLPVRGAVHGLRAMAGEVLVVPSGQQVQLGRDGVVVLKPIDADGMQAPSIDVSFGMAAAAFGAGALAIVFAGVSTDAVAGAQAIHERGGEVWVENVRAADGADMTVAIRAAHLHRQAGTPTQLAARLATHRFGEAAHE